MIRYYVGDEGDLEGLSRAQVKAITYADENDAQTHVEEMLNDAYGIVTICGYEFNAGWALREMDEIAFRQAFLDNTVEVNPNDYPEDEDD